MTRAASRRVLLRELWVQKPVRARGSRINGGIGKSRTGEPWSTYYLEANDLQAVPPRAAHRYRRAGYGVRL